MEKNKLENKVENEIEAPLDWSDIGLAVGGIAGTGLGIYYCMDVPAWYIGTMVVGTGMFGGSFVGAYAGKFAHHVHNKLKGGKIK